MNSKRDRAQTPTRFGQGTTHESLHSSLHTEYNANSTRQNSMKPNTFTSINGCKSNLEL